jgi:maltose alpha-D-glucosyltransferase/alpha-amylase
MLRSFHYAARGVLLEQFPGTRLRPEDSRRLEPWAEFFQHFASVAFLGAYLETVTPLRLLPEDPGELELWLDVHLLEKGLYEIAYEINTRPDWVELPLRGVLQVLERIRTRKVATSDR